MARGPTYTTKELCKNTWSDFVKLFSQGNGWDHCYCMHFHRPCGLPKEKRLHSRVERGARNRRQKKQLVDKGCAHGILVYAEGEPVGWCQYGLKEELPRIDNSRKYEAAHGRPDLAGAGAGRNIWRVTCFVVDKKHRRHGVASTALQAALRSIRKNGGGLVEGYPINRWESRAFGNESTHGTASMFEKAGFQTVAPFGSTRFSDHVLMRKTV